MDLHWSQGVCLLFEAVEDEVCDCTPATLKAALAALAAGSRNSAVAALLPPQASMKARVCLRPGAVLRFSRQIQGARYLSQSPCPHFSESALGLLRAIVAAGWAGDANTFALMLCGC